MCVVQCGHSPATEAGLFDGEGLEVGLETGLGLATRAPTGVGDSGGGAATERAPAGDAFTGLADASSGEGGDRGAGGGGGGGGGEAGADREAEGGEIDAVAVAEGELAFGKVAGEAAAIRA